MKRKKIYINLFAEADEVNFYTIRFDGEEFPETKKFFMNFKEKEEFKMDVQCIELRMGFIGDSGAEDRHFRYAGKMDDNAMELPNNMETSKLRLYCLRLTTNIVILGNGGEKTTATYNEDTWLDWCVNQLQLVDREIKKKRKSGAIVMNGKQLEGTLILYI